MVETIRTPAPFRRRNDRRSILRTLPLSPIGDIASGGLTEDTQTTESITWETSTDWDNAVSESDVEHADAVVSLVGSIENDLNTFTVQDDDNVLTVDSATKLSYTDFDRNDTSRIYKQNAIVLDGTRDVEMRFNFAVPSYTNSEFPGYQVVFANSSSANPSVYSGLFIGAVSGDPDIEIETTEGQQKLIQFNTDGTRYYVNVYFDASASEVTGEVYDSASRDNLLGSGSAAYDGSTTQDYLQVISGDGSSFSSPGNMSGDHSDIRTGDVAGDGNITTATKSFSQSGAPDLSNLAYSLNDGGIDVEVIASPGTGDEEIVTQTLDGASSYSLSWSSTHTDFRINPIFTTPNPTSTPPTVDSITLTT